MRRPDDGRYPLASAPRAIAVPHNPAAAQAFHQRLLIPGFIAGSVKWNLGSGPRATAAGARPRCSAPAWRGVSGGKRHSGIFHAR